MLLTALGTIVHGGPPPVPYEQDNVTGDFWPVTDRVGWATVEWGAGTSCAQG